MGNSKFFKLLTFLFLILIFDQIGGFVLRQLYFHQTAGQDYSLNFSFSECKSDIIIFGNSRAQHHYDSQILADSLQLSCFNAGQDGGHSILLPYAQIKVITERYSPKIIILEFHPDNIVHYPGDYDRLSILLPYYKEYLEIRPIILLRSPYEKVKLLSSIYPFNSDIINMIRFITNIPTARRNDFEGYVPLEGVMSVDILKQDPEIETQAVIDINMLNALKDIISLCKEKNISLFVVSSPLFHAVNERQYPPTTTAKLSLDILQQNNINYLDFSFDSTFIGHLEWFRDRAHLNDKGAKIFTTQLAEILKNKINFQKKEL